jgi:glycosyltransferase involved in cell wall biosynthesis
MLLTFNRAALLPHAIDSVLHQTYPNLEVLVIDNGSRDGTTDVLRGYEGESRVRVIRHESNVGITGGRNTALSNLSADTAYVGILSDDDTLLPGAIETLVQVFEANEGRYSMVFGWSVDPLSGEPTGQMSYREGPVTYDDVLSGRFTGEFFQLVSRALLGDKRFDERALGAEFAIWWPLLRERDGWLVKEVVHQFDTSGDDRASRVSYAPLTAKGRMWAWHAGLAAVGDDLRQRYPRRYGENLIELAKWAALAGERRRAFAAARRAVRYAPSLRSIAMVALVVLPEPWIRSIANWRSRLRTPA